MNAIKYKNLFPLIQANKVWMGVKSTSQAMYFKTSNKEYSIRVSNERPEGSWWRRIDGEVCIGINNSCWFTNLDHGRRHQILPLMTMDDNLKYSKHKEIKGKESYDCYDNYKAIDVSFTDAIPSDYDGVMGVPISFLDKYCPEQFEIIWQASGNTRASAPKEILERLNYRPHPDDRGGCTIVNGKRTYDRIFIKHRKVTL
jgi:hypothetical protein